MVWLLVLVVISEKAFSPKIKPPNPLLDDCSNQPLEKQPHIQSKSFQASNTSHWQCVDKALGSFERNLERNGTTDEPPELQAIRELLGIEDWYHGRRSEFIDRLSKNPLGKKLLKLAKVSSF